MSIVRTVSRNLHLILPPTLQNLRISVHFAATSLPPTSRVPILCTVGTHSHSHTHTHTHRGCGSRLEKLIKSLTNDYNPWILFSTLLSFVSSGKTKLTKVFECDPGCLGCQEEDSSGWQPGMPAVGGGSRMRDRQSSVASDASDTPSSLDASDQKRAKKKHDAKADHRNWLINIALLVLILSGVYVVVAIVLAIRDEALNLRYRAVQLQQGAVGYLPEMDLQLSTMSTNLTAINGTSVEGLIVASSPQLSMAARQHGGSSLAQCAGGGGGHSRSGSGRGGGEGDDGGFRDGGEGDEGGAGEQGGGGGDACRMGVTSNLLFDFAHVVDDELLPRHSAGARKKGPRRMRDGGGGGEIEEEEGNGGGLATRRAKRVIEWDVTNGRPYRVSGYWLGACAAPQLPSVRFAKWRWKLYGRRAGEPMMPLLKLHSGRATTDLPTNGSPAFWPLPEHLPAFTGLKLAFYLDAEESSSGGGGDEPESESGTVDALHTSSSNRSDASSTPYSGDTVTTVACVSVFNVSTNLDLQKLVSDQVTALPMYQSFKNIIDATGRVFAPSSNTTMRSDFEVRFKNNSDYLAFRSKCKDASSLLIYSCVTTVPSLLYLLQREIIETFNREMEGMHLNFNADYVQKYVIETLSPMFVCGRKDEDESRLFQRNDPILRVVGVKGMWLLPSISAHTR